MTAKNKIEPLSRRVAADGLVVDGGRTHIVAVTRHVEYDIAAEALVTAAAFMVMEQGFPATMGEAPKAAQDGYNSGSLPLGICWTALTLKARLSKSWHELSESAVSKVGGGAELSVRKCRMWLSENDEN
jgi:hypothetical protein